MAASALPKSFGPRVLSSGFGEQVYLCVYIYICREYSRIMMQGLGCRE